jgi:hypothetical protein
MAINALLGIKEVSFITDNQLLVNYYKEQNYDMLPHWSIKSSAQSFVNALFIWLQMESPKNMRRE